MMAAHLGVHDPDLGMTFSLQVLSAQPHTIARGYRDAFFNAFGVKDVYERGHITSFPDSMITFSAFQATIPMLKIHLPFPRTTHARRR